MCESSVFKKLSNPWTPFFNGVTTFYETIKPDDLVKSQDLDGFEKCSRSRRANPEE